MRLVTAVLSLFSPLFIGQSSATELSPLHDVPGVEGIVIDGKGDDWGDRGFRVGLLGDEQGNFKPASDLDASFRLGWDKRGLLVLVNVTDDVADEAKTGEIYEKDSVELFCSTKCGAPDVVQMVISPGVDPQCPELRTTLKDERETELLKKKKVSATAVRTKTAAGYTLEALLPWDNLGIVPADGRELALQIYVNDADGGRRFQARWYPRGSGHDSRNMEPLRLSNGPSPAINATATGGYELFRRMVIRVTGTSELIGKICTLKEGDKELDRSPFLEEGGRAGAKFVLPIPSDRKPSLSLIVDGQPPLEVNIPDLQAARAKAFMDQKLSFDPNVFTGPAFPKCDFEQPAYVEDLIGPYTISTTFYDSGYNRVTTAGKPGRYGAVVEIRTKRGETFRRLRTLFCLPGNFPWWKQIRGTFEFPEETGINAAVVAEQKSSIGKYLKLLVKESFSHDSNSSLSPALMCGLFEAKEGAADAPLSDDFQARDRQWWVGLKRKLSAADKAYPAPFVCPRVIDGKPATVLHEGSMKEAGMKPDTAGKLDSLLSDWSANSDEAFAVCVARHGVIVLCKAYGRRDGKPMTVDTESWMASITKSMSGTLMMMLVDQGLVNLDDPVSKYLPSFGAATVPAPLTIRHLYTHTSGLQGHWGDDLNDFDDVIAGYYPNLPVGKRFEYNGAGASLGSKIVETITGEALPQFYERHLLGPLGCSHTNVVDSSGGATSTPMDIAKFGQMLLNRGSYGDKQFLSPETFEKFLPVRLTKLLGPETTVNWGIGLAWCNGDGLGKGTFGHGAASSATLRIDPENDMVIVMTRNAAGKNFTDYHRQFLAAITDSISK